MSVCLFYTFSFDLFEPHLSEYNILFYMYYTVCQTGKIQFFFIFLFFITPNSQEVIRTTGEAGLGYNASLKNVEF